MSRYHYHLRDDSSRWQRPAGGAQQVVVAWKVECGLVVHPLDTKLHDPHRDADKHSDQSL